MAQATEANRPALILSGLGTSPVMRFAAASAQYLTTGSIAGISQPFYVSTVGKRTGTFTLSGVFFGTSALSFPVAFYGAGTNTVSIYGSTAVLSQNSITVDNTWAAIQTVFNGASNSHIYINGTDKSGTTGTNATGTGNWQLGKDNTTSNYLSADITEEGFFNSAPSVGNMSSRNSNQHSRYGF